jgi:hypothetical protein
VKEDTEEVKWKGIKSLWIGKYRNLTVVLILFLPSIHMVRKESAQETY